MTTNSLQERIDELVLGLASEADAAEIEALCQSDPSIASQVERTRNRFLALDETADNLPLPIDFWQRVEASLDGTLPGQSEAGEQPSARIIDLAATRAAVKRWRVTAFASAAAAAVLALAIGWMASQTLGPKAPVVIAILLDTQGQPIAVVESNKENKTLITLLKEANVPNGQVMQVWTKPDDNGKPVSLGLLADARSRVLTVEGLPVPHPDQLYEITFEPSGGSPVNLPTGPILGKGFAKAPVY